MLKADKAVPKTTIFLQPARRIIPSQKSAIKPIMKRLTEIGSAAAIVPPASPNDAKAPLAMTIGKNVVVKL